MTMFNLFDECLVSKIILHTLIPNKEQYSCRYSLRDVFDGEQIIQFSFNLRLKLPRLTPLT